MDPTLVLWILIVVVVFLAYRVERLTYEVEQLKGNPENTPKDCNHIYWPVSDGKGGFSGQECSLCGKFNKLEKK